VTAVTRHHPGGQRDRGPDRRQRTLTGPGTPPAVRHRHGGRQHNDPCTSDDYVRVTIDATTARCPCSACPITHGLQQRPTHERACHAHPADPCATGAGPDLVCSPGPGGDGRQVGLVLDGGDTYAQRRDQQNGADLGPRRRQRLPQHLRTPAASARPPRPPGAPPSRRDQQLLPHGGDVVVTATVNSSRPARIR
jgi:hypothetical protein